MVTTEQTTTNEAILSNEQNEELFKVTPIKETPFATLKQDDKYYLLLGKYRLTEALKNEKEVEEAATDASWHRIMQICSIMITESDEMHELKKRIEKLENTPKKEGGKK